MERFKDWNDDTQIEINGHVVGVEEALMVYSELSEELKDTFNRLDMSDIDVVAFIYSTYFNYQIGQVQS